MQFITPVVRHLLIINVLFFVGTIWLGEQRYMLAAHYPSSEFFEPFQLVTYMFMHADLGHIFFNMFAVYMFGPPVEALWGEKKFLTYYFITGFGALAAHFAVKYFEMQGMDPATAALATDVPILGASGSVFGLLLAFGMLFPEQRVMLLFPPIPMKARVMVILYAVLELVLGVGNMDSGVAHFAHLGGALTGFLMILYWQGFRLR